MRISDWSSDVCSSDLRTLLAFGEIVQVRVVGPVAFGFLLDVMLDRRKLVEALMTEAAIVRAGAEQCRIDLLHRRRNVNCLIEEPNLGAERLCFRGGQTLGPAQLRLCDAGQHAAAEYGGRWWQRGRDTFQYISSLGL